MVRRFYAWACERLYDELAWSYNGVSWLVSFGWWDQWRALALHELQGTRVLEIGFGTGALLPKVAARAALPVGLELSSAMHRQAGRKLAALGLRLPLVQARAQTMPFADHSFDTVLATFPAPYILEPATLAECARVLTAPCPAGTPVSGACQGGRLVIVGLWVAFAQEGWLARLPLFYGRPPAAALTRVAALLTAAGFAPTITERPVGPFRVGVVIAERGETRTS